MICAVCGREPADGVITARLDKFPACEACIDSVLFFIVHVAGAKPAVPQDEQMRGFRAWVDGRRNPDTWA